MAICNGRNDRNFRKLRRLYARACEFAEDEDSAPCLWFYRNKSKKYFRDISEYDDGVMKVILKDNSGDPDCPINGRLSGLFFMASVQSDSDSGEPLPMSPFGPCRLLVPAEDLLDISKSKLYFADFYCMKNNHYVTLVITVPGLKADQFCRTHLPSVDIMDNPFLFVDEDDDDDRLFVTTTDRLLVEVFYTEDLDISDYKLRSTPTIGKGHSTRGGIPKNKLCRVCNL